MECDYIIIIISTALAYLLLSSSSAILIAQQLLPFPGKQMLDGGKSWANIASLLRNLHNLLIQVWNCKLILVKVLNTAVKDCFLPFGIIPISLKPLAQPENDVSLPVRKRSPGVKLSTGLTWYSPDHSACCKGSLRVAMVWFSSVTDLTDAIIMASFMKAFLPFFY